MTDTKKTTTSTRRAATNLRRIECEKLSAARLKEVHASRQPRHPRLSELLDAESRSLYGILDNANDGTRATWVLIASHHRIPSTGESTHWVTPHPDLESFNEIVLVEKSDALDRHFTTHSVSLAGALRFLGEV